MIRALARQDREAGAAAVEFALIMPILFLLLFGIFEFGRAYHVQVSLTGAAREGARHMAITGDATAASQRVIAASALSPAPSVAITTAASPASPAPDCPADDNATVTVTADIPVSIPFYTAIDPDGTWTIDGEAVMRCGG